MNIKKFKGSRALALFIALTMVMMYSFTFTAAVYGDLEFHKVTYNKNGGDPETSYAVGSTVTVAAFGTPPNGKIFTGWKLNGLDKDLHQPPETRYQPGYTFTMPDNNVNFKATFRNDGSPTTYTVTYKDGDQSVFDDQVTDDLILGEDTPDPPEFNDPTGWTFTGWLPVWTTTVGGTVVYIAQWSENQTTPTYDLGITKVVDNESVRLGSEATFTITITNSSNSAITAEAIYADDDWPEGLSINGVVAEEGTSYEGSWWIGTLIPGQSKVLTITAIATTIGPITNTISIRTDRPSGDTNKRNDSASATIEVYDPTTVTILKDVPNITDSTELFDVTIYKRVYVDPPISDFAAVRFIQDQDTTLEAIRDVKISEVASYLFDVTDSGLYTFVETTKAGYTTSQASFEIEVEVGPDGDQTVTFVNTKDNTDTSTNNTTTRTRRTTPTPVVIVEPEIPLAEEPVVTPIIMEEPVPLADVVPQTSDAGNIWLLLGLMLGSGLGITALGRRKETE